MPSLRSANAQGTSIEGLWGTETVLGAPVAGQLTIDGRRGKWLASIDGYTVSASLSNGILTFSLPGDKGRSAATLSLLSKSWRENGYSRAA